MDEDNFEFTETYKLNQLINISSPIPPEATAIH
jgi:hypothetical protein